MLTFYEVLYRRGRWKECYEFLNKVKIGEIKARILHFTIHSVSAILGKPEFVSKLISEIARALAKAKKSIFSGIEDVIRG